eukprot:1673838-Alexandrium_andersonii.AAC.1
MPMPSSNGAKAHQPEASPSPQAMDLPNSWQVHDPPVRHAPRIRQYRTCGPCALQRAQTTRALGQAALHSG